MGLRSRTRRVSIRLLESLVGTHREDHLACRVCAAEQAIRADDQSICASHLLTHLDSLAPGLPTPAASLPSATTASPVVAVSTVSTAPTNTTHKIRRKSLPPRNSAATALASTSRSTCLCVSTDSDACSRGTCGCRYNCGCDCNCIDNQAMYLLRRESEQHTRLQRVSVPAGVGPDPKAIVQSLQTALGNVRYAISGHLGVQLQASRTDKGSCSFRAAFTNEALSNVTLAMSEATRPSIVCPRSTLDVLPSWAAAAWGQYTFGPEPGAGADDGKDRPSPSALRINVDGTLTKVHVDWIDDEQFNCAPYVVEELKTSFLSSTVPVLSMSSLISRFYTNSLPASRVDKPLPPIPAAEESCLFR